MSVSHDSPRFSDPTYDPHFDREVARCKDCDEPFAESYDEPKMWCEINGRTTKVLELCEGCYHLRVKEEERETASTKFYEELLGSLALLDIQEPVVGPEREASRG